MNITNASIDGNRLYMSLSFETKRVFHSRMFSNDIKREVWAKATKVDGFDPVMFRKDPCGAWIVWNKYGLRDNDYGWEIDHVYPLALGGGEELENLRAMNWRNNDSKSDDYPSYIAMVESSGNSNKDCYKSCAVNKSLQEWIKKTYIDK